MSRVCRMICLTGFAYAAPTHSWCMVCAPHVSQTCGARTGGPHLLGTFMAIDGQSKCRLRCRLRRSSAPSAAGPGGQRTSTPRSAVWASHGRTQMGHRFSSTGATEDGACLPFPKDLMNGMVPNAGWAVGRLVGRLLGGEGAFLWAVYFCVRQSDTIRNRSTIRSADWTLERVSHLLALPPATSCSPATCCKPPVCCNVTSTPSFLASPDVRNEPEQANDSLYPPRVCG